MQRLHTSFIPRMRNGDTRTRRTNYRRHQGNGNHRKQGQRTRYEIVESSSYQKETTSKVHNFRTLSTCAQSAASGRNDLSPRPHRDHVKSALIEATLMRVGARVRVDTRHRDIPAHASGILRMFSSYDTLARREAHYMARVTTKRAPHSQTTAKGTTWQRTTAVTITDGYSAWYLLRVSSQRRCTPRPILTPRATRFPRSASIATASVRAARDQGRGDSRAVSPVSR